MRRRMVALLLAGILIVGAGVLAGCGNQKDNQTGNAVSSAESVVEKEGAEEEMNVSEPVNVDDTLSFDDTIVTDLIVKLDGADFRVKMYEDCYVLNPTNVAMIPNEDGVDQKISIYIPENAKKTSPILFCVNNSGWIMDAYEARTQVEDGADYESDSDSDMIGMALSKGYVIVSHGCRSRGDNPNEDGKYVSHSPATMTDTKAAIRYLRKNAAELPAGDPEKIVITGTSGGGALSAVIASSGDSPDYFESLYEIGAAGVEKQTDGTFQSTISDGVFATIAYCPINDLRQADAAYEWTYRQARQKLIDDGLPKVDEKTGETFQDPFEGDYTPEWMMEASKALADEYTRYVNSLKLRTETGAVMTGNNLSLKLRQLLNEGFAKAADEVGVDQMKKDLAGDADYSGQKTAAMFNAGSEGWVDFFSYDADGVPYLADDQALQDYLYFVARNQTLKGACAFSNKGLSEKGLASVSGFNEDSLFGSEDYPYSAFEFYSWNNDAVKDNGCGLDDTGKTWDQFMATEEGKALALQMQMASPIPYLTTDNGTSAAHWYVRHGLRDRDTAFALQTVLYYALFDDKNITDLDFAFAWLQPHAGNYDVQEAAAWLEKAL